MEICICIIFQVYVKCLSQKLLCKGDEMRADGCGELTRNWQMVGRRHKYSQSWQLKGW